MTRLLATLACAFSLPITAAAQQSALTPAQIESAALEVPRLVDLMTLAPGMTVADVGAGFGAWTVELSRVVGPSGRVYASDIGEAQLQALQAAVDRERLTNVVVVKGDTRSTNLPAGCCDAILMRDVYHHLTEPADINRNLAASLKPGGRLVVIDFPPRANSEVPAGVPANRLGHGVPAEVVAGEVGAHLTHVRTMPDWSPESQPAALYLVLFHKP